MSIETSTDVKSIEHLDFEPRCLVRGRPGIRIPFTDRTMWGPLQGDCERPAKFIIRCLGCRNLATCCEEHRVYISALRGAMCMKCGAVGLGSEIFEFEPLGGTP